MGQPSWFSSESRLALAQVVLSRKRLRKNRRSGRTHPVSLDDIPLARRTHAVPGQDSSRLWVRLLPAVSLALFLGLAAMAVFQRPFRDLLSSAPQDGLLALRSPDGRLLGHFPYPEAKASQLVTVEPGMRLRHDAARSYRAMEQAAVADGIPLALLSAFRSVSEQEQLFFAVKAQRNQPAIDRAKVSAPPGFSEHSTGFAIDIGDPSQPHTHLSPTFTQTRAYRWLRNNAARFQFTLSFPPGNPQGVNFEPWHWRYEGTVEALRLFEPAQRLHRAVPRP